MVVVGFSSNVLARRQLRFEQLRLLAIARSATSMFMAFVTTDRGLASATTRRCAITNSMTRSSPIRYRLGPGFERGDELRDFSLSGVLPLVPVVDVHILSQCRNVPLGSAVGSMLFGTGVHRDVRVKRM